MKKILFAIMLSVGITFAQNYLRYDCKNEVTKDFDVQCYTDGSTKFIRTKVNGIPNIQHNYFSKDLGGKVIQEILYNTEGNVLQVEEFFPNGSQYYLLTYGVGEPIIQFNYNNQNLINNEIIQNSIDSYGGNCPCPYNRDARGYQCGERSAYSRYGGYSPICYNTDIEQSDMNNLKDYLITKYK